jgi:hypothetical protein
MSQDNIYNKFVSCCALYILPVLCASCLLLDDDTKEGKPSEIKPSPWGDDAQGYWLQQWGQVDDALLQGYKLKGLLAASKNNRWVYFATEDPALNFAGIDLASGFSAAFQSPHSWFFNLIKASGTGLNDQRPGQASLIGQSNYYYNAPAENGIVLSVSKPNALVKASYGMIYFEGSVVKKAWSGDNKDIYTGLTFGSVVAAREPLVPFVVMARDSKEYLYVTTKNVDYIGVGELGPYRIDKAVKGPRASFFDAALGNHKFDQAQVIQSFAGGPLYIVDKKAIRVLDSSQIGKDYEFPQSNPQFQDQRSLWGAKKLSKIITSGTKLYFIAGDGVVVYDIDSKKVAFDSKTWLGIGNLLDLAVDGEKVFAVTPTALHLIEPEDGRRGDAITVNSLVPNPSHIKNIIYDDAGDNNRYYPSNNINSALFIKGNLIITTNNSIFYRKKAEFIKIKI